MLAVSFCFLLLLYFSSSQKAYTLEKPTPQSQTEVLGTVNNYKYV